MFDDLGDLVFESVFGCYVLFGVDAQLVEPTLLLLELLLNFHVGLHQIRSIELILRFA
jgi:hypothetical protein